MSVGLKKCILGQFFTKDAVWLKPQICEFIAQSNCSVVYDPFAGNGDLIEAARKNLHFEKATGLDIDSALPWDTNDSLLSIPHIDQAIIITNPPYISNYSASRKKIMAPLEKYFRATPYDDLYLLALDRMLDAQQYVVAIIPETFINSNFRRKNLLHSLTVIEDSPFEDTDSPVLVACFDGIVKDFSRIKVYKNAKYVDTLENLENARLIPDRSISVTFNDIDGWLGVRCVDTTNPKNKLHFDYKENIDYDWEQGIKVSSRLLTLIQVDVPPAARDDFIETCNTILNDIRTRTNDLVLSPFKGNMSDGCRRRRLDFITCRAIIEMAYKKSVEKERISYEQLRIV